MHPTAARRMSGTSIKAISMKHRSLPVPLIVTIRCTRGEPLVGYLAEQSHKGYQDYGSGITEVNWLQRVDR